MTTDRALIEVFADDEHHVRRLRLAGERVRFQGLPACICWLGYGQRAARRFERVFTTDLGTGVMRTPTPGTRKQPRRRNAMASTFRGSPLYERRPWPQETTVQGDAPIAPSAGGRGP